MCNSTKFFTIQVFFLPLTQLLQKRRLTNAIICHIILLNKVVKCFVIRNRVIKMKKYMVQIIAAVS